MKLRKVLNDPPKDYYDKLAHVESNNNPLAKAKTSSAAGLYQFTESTWLGLTKELGLNYSLEDRFDPKKSREVVESFTSKNETYLKNKLGRKPNDAELYLAHFSGMGGARKLLETVEKNPNTTVDKFVSKNALKANKNVFFNKDGSPKKAYEIYNWSAKKFGAASIEPPKQEDLNESQNNFLREKSFIKEIDNIQTVQTRIPDLATPPINSEELNEQALREILSKEKQSTEQQFLNAFSAQNTEQQSIAFTPEQQDLSHLYNYITLED